MTDNGVTTAYCIPAPPCAHTHDSSVRPLACVVEKPVGRSFVWRCEVECSLCVRGRPQGGSVGRVLSTLMFVAGLRTVGRSIGSTRLGCGHPSGARWVGRSGRSGPKVSPPRCAQRVGRSGQPELETPKPHILGRSVDDAERTINFAPPRLYGGLYIFASSKDLLEQPTCYSNDSLSHAS